MGIKYLSNFITDINYFLIRDSRGSKIWFYSFFAHTSYHIIYEIS